MNTFHKVRNESIYTLVLGVKIISDVVLYYYSQLRFSPALFFQPFHRIVNTDEKDFNNSIYL